jgi:hypothetical protein
MNYRQRQLFVRNQTRGKYLSLGCYGVTIARRLRGDTFFRSLLFNKKEVYLPLNLVYTSLIKRGNKAL